MASKLDQLTALSGAIPGLNEEAAKRAKAASAMQLQQAVAQAPSKINAAAASQQLTPQTTLQQGQIGLAANQQTQQQLGQLGQQGLQQQAAQAQNRLGQAELAQRQTLANQQIQQGLQLSQEELASKKRMTQDELAMQQRLSRLGMMHDSNIQFATLRQREQLSSLGNDLKSKLIDARLMFEADENGRKFSNERQMQDWIISNAKSEIDFKLKAQQMEQVQKRKIQLLEAAYQKLSDELSRKFQTEEGEKNFIHQQHMTNIKTALEKKIAKEKAAAANRASIWGMAGGIVGGVLGAVFTRSAGGAAMGSAVGSGVGTAIGGASSS